MEIGKILYEGQVQGLALAIFQNEKPPCGLAGIVDWHIHGRISRFLKSGAITGKIGECTYFPIRRKDSIFHFILAGAGLSEAPGIRNPVPKETIQSLYKNLVSLKIPKIGISQSDFGMSSDAFTEQFKGVSLWISP